MSAPAHPRASADVVTRTVPGAGGGNRTRLHDLLGRLLEEHDEAGAQLRYRYDARGRVRAAEHSSGERVEYEVDDVRRTWTARTARTRTTVFLTRDGLPERIETEVDGRRWSIAERRGERGEVLASRYPEAADWLEHEQTPDGSVVTCCGERRYWELVPGIPGAVQVRFATGVTLDEEAGAAGLEWSRLRDAAGSGAWDVRPEYDASGRIVAAGDRRATYDDAGRLAEWDAGSGRRRYDYDERGRLAGSLGYGESAAVAWRDGGHSYESDARGRRTACHGPMGTTRYGYDLFGRLARVELPDGDAVQYVYDGFGRLVGREGGGEVEYYAVDLDGRRLARLDAAARVTDSYLWLGQQCLGRVAGPLGGPLAETYHRIGGALAAATGDAEGTLVSVAGADPYGADWALDARAPGYAGLFGDPATGLLHAGARWLDPATAQFLTPDPWFGAEGERRYAPSVAGALAALPGGLTAGISADEAWAWCGYDPVNRIDPTGHNWLGLIFSIISFFVWEMGLTAIALEMEVLSIVVWLLMTVLFVPFWSQGASDFYREYAIYNIPHPVASYRLMVPLGLILNGVLRIQKERAWALGNVIWYSGDRMDEVEQQSARALLVCPNASSYLTAAQDATTDSTLNVRSPTARRTGTVANVGATSPAVLPQITNLAPAAPALSQVFARDDWVAVGIVGSAGLDEVREVDSSSGSTLELKLPPLPAAYGGQSVTVTRLDPSVAQIASGDRVTARTITFIRGQAVHLLRRVLPQFSGTLAVTELMPAEVPRPGRGGLPVEFVVIRFAKDADRTDYGVGEFVRLLSLGAYTARKVIALRGTADVVIDEPLPPGAHTSIEVVRLDPAGAPATGQNGSGSRVEAGALEALRPRDGLVIDDAAAAPAVARVVTAVLLSCAVDPLPAALIGAPIQVDRLMLGAERAEGTVEDATHVVTTDAPPFSAGQPVRLSKDPATHAHAVLAAVDTPAKRLTFSEPLPAAFAATTAVTVKLMISIGSAGTFDAEGAVAPGTKVIVKTDRGDAIGNGEPLRIRPAADTQGGAVRLVAGAPLVLADLDRALPAAFTSGLSVDRLVPNAGLTRTGASAPDVRTHVAVTTSPMPAYAVGERVHLTDSANEQTVVTIAAINGADLVLADLIVGSPLATTGLSLKVVEPTGITTNDARLDEARVMIPSAPEEEPITLRAALEQHEMRHVWQGAVWGPFLLSLPIPWLVDVGVSVFAPASTSNSASNVVRHISVGGIDSGIAGIIWAAKGSEQPIQLDGQVADAGLKKVTLAAGSDTAKLARLKAGLHVGVHKGDKEVFNVLDAVDGLALSLRFSLGSEFASGDPVRVSMSPFEQIRKTVSDWLNLNVAALWADHIPTTWGRALNRVLNRDSWLPGLGIYFLSLYITGCDETRLPNEQDAAYHSGDLYTSIPVTREAEIYVGQFARVFAFIQERNAGTAAVASVSARGVVGLLEVELATGATAANVSGAVPSTFGGQPSVRFRENWYIPLADRVENAVGAFFATSHPGSYRLHAPGELPPNTDVVFKFAFAVSFLELSTVQVKDIGITPDPAQPLFETEGVDFRVAGDSTATYALRFPAGAAGLGNVNGLRYRASVLPAGTASQPDKVEVTATYAADHAVFSGPGQLAPTRLTADQRTNLAKAIELTVQRIDPPTLAAIKAGETRDFTMPIAPISATVAAPPAGVTGTASVILRPGRPAPLTFVAPSAVTAPVTISFDMVFGTDPASRKTVTATIEVRPA